MSDRITAEDFETLARQLEQEIASKFKVGDRVRLAADREIANGHCFVGIGEEGTIVEMGTGDNAILLGIKMDKYFHFLDEWENQVLYVAEDFMYYGQTIDSSVEKIDW